MQDYCLTAEMGDHETGHRTVRMRLDSQEAMETLSLPESLENLSPDANEVYEEMLEHLGFPRVATASEEDKQLVVEGQVLVLGDARQGKTSLVKALTGKKHDPDQAKTHGLESQVVNRKWRKIEGDKLIFGDFNRFSKTELTETAFLPRIFNKEKYQYGRNTTEDPDELYSVIFHYMFGWFYYLYSRLREDEIEEESKPFIDRLLMMFIFVPGLAMVFGYYWARLLLGCLFLLVELTKTAMGKGVKENFFRFWGILLGLEIAAWCNFRLHVLSDIISPYLHENSMPAICTSIIGSCTVLILLIASQFLLFECISLGSFLFSFLNCKLPVLANKFKLVFNILLDVQENLFTMLSITIGALFMTICSPMPGILPYSYVRICISFMTFCFHIISLYKQGHNLLLFKYYTGNCFLALVVVESSMLMCCLFSNYKLYNQSSNLVLFVIIFIMQFTTYCYGRWCEIRKLFKGKSFSDIVFREDFIKTALIVEKATIDRRNLKRALNKRFCSLKLKLLDFAGDNDYYYYHHIFLKTHAIYIIVFNIKNFINENFKDIKRNMERLRFWFESVCAHVPATTPIFLVGTHSGKTNQDELKILHYHLHDELWPDFCDHLVISEQDDLIFFHVENSCGSSDEGVQLVRNGIHKVAEKECRNPVQNEVPFSWIKVQDYILTMQNESFDLCCVKVEDFKRQVGHLCNPWPFDHKMLEYFHTKGLIIFLKNDKKLSKWILLNPGILVDIVVEIVNPPPETTRERGYRQCWKMLTELGILANELLHSILEKFGDNWEVMKNYLEGYDLICPLEHEVHQEPDNATDSCFISPTHFIPSLLPESFSTKPIWHAKVDDKKFFVSFERFPPEPLFHRLLSRAHKQSKAVCPSSHPIVRRDDGLFWLTPWQPYRMKLLKEEGLIEVTVCRFHCGPECPSSECPGDQYKVNAFLCGQQSSTKRHIFNILPACCGGSHRVPFNCLNQSFETEIKEWIPNMSGPVVATEG